MAEYEVEQILARTQKVIVEAANKDEARQKAKEGYGEVVAEDTEERLLASDAKRMRD